SARLRKENGFWLGVFVLAVLFSLGDAIPLGNVVLRLPVFSWLRVPSRAMFLAGLSMAIMVASAVQWVTSSTVALNRQMMSRTLAVLFGLAAFSIFLTVGIYFSTHIFSLEFTWGTVSIALVSLLFAARLLQPAKMGFFLALLAPCVALDLCGVNASLVQFKPAGEVLSENESVAKYLDSSGGERFRVYSPSYSLPQQTAARFGLELADGIDPLQIEAYVAFMQPATGVPAGGYSVTMPPFETGNPRVDNRKYRPDANLLGLLNVRYIVSEFEVQAEGIILKARVGPTRIYQNERVLPRAWVTENEPGEMIHRAAIQNETPNGLEVVAEGPGTLVLSVVNYPGWTATVDGSPVEIESYESLLQSVHLPEGNHRVIFQFRPPLLYLGIFIAVIGALIILWKTITA
ncbi:MAG: YfhO family protein, partial [Anaerolineaceae bacterium]|nr:YfhO family protein [Anaerolineaceae bacterium]